MATTTVGESVVRIPVRAKGSRLMYAIVDACDKYLLRHKWCLSDGYATSTVCLPVQRSIRMHREVLGLVKGDGKVVDHINGNRLDNRRANLRITDYNGNAQNKRSWREDGRRGVTREAGCKRWRAQVKHNYKNIHLGYFDSADEAARAAADKRHELGFLDSAAVVARLNDMKDADAGDSHG